jgi:hypothetical protein
LSWGSLGGALNPLGLRFEAVPGEEPVPTGTFIDTISETMLIDSGAVHALSGSADLALGYVLEYPTVALTSAETVLRLPAISEGFGVNPVPDVVLGIAGVVTDEVQVASTLLAYFGQVISETIGSADALGPTMVSGALLAETLGVAELLQSASPATLTDNVDVASVLTMVQGAVLSDILGVSEAVLGQTIAQVIQTEGVTLSDALLKFLSGDVSEGVGISQSDAAVLLASGVLSDAVGIAETVTPLFLLRVTLADTIGIDPDEALQMLFNPTVAEGVEITAAYLSPGGGITTWAMNTQTAAVTEYSNYNFNSFARLGTRYVAASDQGIYSLEGTTDNGTNIIAKIKSGFAQFSGSKFTSFKAAYLGVRGEGDFILRVVDGEGKSYDYAVSTRNTRSTKVHMGKGLRARYFSFELISTGQDFDLDSVEFVPITENRRV